MSIKRIKSDPNNDGIGHAAGRSQQATSYKHSDKYRKMKRKMAERSHKINTRGKKSVK